VAMGGFVSGPAVAAARAAGVRSVLVNLDAVPGKANRFLAPKCDRVLTVYPTDCLGQAEAVAMPLRLGCLSDGEQAADRRALGLEPTLNTLLVTGASQGATSLNELMADLIRRHVFAKAMEGWQVLHLCGKDGAGELARAYERAEIPAKVLAFCHEMGRAWGAADLAISRAGAGSVAEAAANGVPSVFFPYPYHKDQHQRLNAEPFANAGGAVIAEDMIDPQRNAAKHLACLTNLLTDDDRRAAMSSAMCAEAGGDGAKAVADAAMALARGASG